jgi:O-antigen ligase
MKQQNPRVRQAGAVALGIFCFLIPFSQAAVEISFPLLLVLWLWGWGRLPRHRVFGLLGLYLAVCFISIFLSSFPMLSLVGFICKTLEYALLFFIAADLADQPQAGQRVNRALLAAGALVVLYGLLQEWAIHKALYKSMVPDPIQGHILDYVRMVGPYKNPNDLATFLMVTALVAIGWMLRSSTARPEPSLLVLTTLLLGCLIRTQSLGAMLGLFGGLALLGIFHRKRPWIFWRLSCLATGLAALSLFLSRSSLQGMLTLSDIPSRDRAAMWQTAWAMIQDRPVMGHGLNTFMANYSRYSVDASHNPAYAHNCFLQITAETGVVGLIAFVLFLTSLGWLIWNALGMRTEPSQEDHVSRAVLEGVSAGLLGFLIQSMFDTNLYALRQAVLFWTLSGVAAGMSFRLLRGWPQS